MQPAAAIGLATLFLLAAGCREADAQCVTYYRPKTQIRGTLVRQTFPGRPEYSSVASGDEPETGFYLRLRSPICGRPAADEKDADADASLAQQDSVVLVQLLLDSVGYATLRPQLGKTIVLEGKTFAWITGHHHARILLDVTKPVKVIK
jgi:hypothetical protein